MKKSKFIKSTLILLVGGILTKLLGMIIKVATTRALGTTGIGIYMLLMPTFSLFIGLAQLGMPVAISKLVAENKRNNKNLVFSAVPITLLVNVLIILFLLLIHKYLANNLLQEPRCTYALVCIGLVLPFISISSILRSYFFGREKMIPHVVSNVTEDVVRLICIVIGTPFFLRYGIEYAVSYIILTNVASELTSILVLFLFLPKNFKITKKDLKPNIVNVKEILGISLPTTSSRLIGSIGYFFEPIILTFGLLKSGYSNDFIVTEYGIVTGYVMPLLLFPSFFTMAISQALLPIISNSYVNGNYKYCKNKIKQALFLSLLIGIPITLFFYFHPEFSLNFLFKTSEGTKYLKVLAPIFIIYYIQSPLTTSLQGINMAKCAMKGTLGGVFIRVSLLLICSFLKIGLWGLVIATSANMIYVTYHHFYHIKRKFKNFPIT